MGVFVKCWGREGSGRADILMLNAMGFMAGALGNHEFDAGTGTLASLIAADREYVGTAFPFLSANLDFSLDSNLASLVVDPGQEASTIPNSITKSVVITIPSGEKVGVVGINNATAWKPLCTRERRDRTGRSKRHGGIGSHHPRIR